MRGTRPMLQPRLLCLIVTPFLLAPPSPAGAEMLQFSTPDGVKSWPKLADIPDWHQDQESSMKLGANSLIPDGVDPAASEVTIQARGFSRTGAAAATSVSQMVDSDRAGAPSGTEVKQLS